MSDRAAARPRARWADAARGACILLVVLWHLETKHYSRLPGVPEPVLLVWQTADLVVQPVRVPLFFLLSGWLAAGVVRRGWPEVRRRALAPYWTYVVWLVLGSAFFAVAPPLATRTARSAGELALGLVVGYVNTWYLYALAAYLLVARMAVRLPLRVALGAAAVVAVLADTPVAPTIGTAAGLMANLLFFLAGALAPHWVEALVARADARTTARVVAAYLPLAGLAVAAGVSRLAVFSTLLSVLGTAAGVLVAVRAAHTRPSALLARLGRVTLPVYVLHLPLLALLHAAVPALPPDQVVLAAVYPVLAVLGLTAAALAVHAALVRCGLGVLFRPPRGRRDLASAR